jgi:very-short-patch-repair endonuclease
VYECSICGAIRKEETLRMIQGKTCSKTCSSIKGYLSGNRKPTDIEQKLASTLDELGIEYMTQKPLLGITIADVFIFPNVAIFADGEYWHNLEGQKASDAEKTKRLRKRGYVVLRLDGATILKNDEELKNKVTEAYGKRKIKKQL